MLGGLVFGGLLSFGLVLYATEDHPSALFKEYCAKCHGEDGTANTPKGRQLMARDMTDAEFQASKSDAALIKQVTDGGEDMPPFGKKLTKEQIESLVKNDVRGFATKKKGK
ncbi:MAG TPA: cytochrome c [Thermoanaerobaculia bacterium]|nr:cytochrome c [Thermoanaerobaculia bacterium]